jgi:prevent-host-death family protein
MAEKRPWRPADGSISRQNRQNVQFVYFAYFGLSLGMRSVSATHAKQNFAAVLDSAQREPVVIRRHNRDVAVVVSPEDFEKIRRANILELQALADRVGNRAASLGMNEQVLAELLADKEAS